MVYFSHKQERGVCYEKISTIKMDCLLLMEVEVDEDGNIEEYEYLNICYPEEE
jgi:hypothetical protein